MARRGSRARTAFVRAPCGHSLPAVKYQALATGAVDVIDGYSTDGLLSKYDLVTLVDDKHFFPPYEAAALVGARLARERPDAIAALTMLSGLLDESRMRVLNRRIEVDGEDVKRVARRCAPRRRARRSDERRRAHQRGSPDSEIS